jgi:hypothetical protein
MSTISWSCIIRVQVEISGLFFYTPTQNEQKNRVSSLSLNSGIPENRHAYLEFFSSNYPEKDDFEFVVDGKTFHISPTGMKELFEKA